MTPTSASVGGLKTFAAIFALLLCSGAASAQTLELLGPEGAVSPEGFLIAIVERGADRAFRPVDDVKLDVHGASIRAAPPRPPLKTFLVVPAPDAREVSVRATHGKLSVKRTFQLGPPAARVSLALKGAAPVKGRDSSVSLSVKLVGEGGAPDAESPPPVLQSNVGTISDLKKVAPGEYRATYVLPETRYPEVAVIAAFAPWPHPSAIHGAIGSLLVPLASAIDLPGRTEPNAKMSIEIAGNTYGPVAAGPDGRFSLPVVVPPGHRFGSGLVVDRAGNRRKTKIDLMLPPTDQLACVMNPRRLPADGISRARIVCATSDPYGAPTRSARIQLGAAAGQLSDRRTLGDGLYEWIYSAPSELSAQPVTLSAEWRQGRNLSKDSLALELVQGAAERLEVASDEALLHFGGQAQVSAQAKDALGRARDGATLKAEAPFGSVAIAARDAGRFDVVWTPPADGDAAEAALGLRAFGPAGSEPARITAWKEGNEIRVGLTDLSGWPVPNQPVLVGGREVRTGEDGSAGVGVLAPGAHRLRHATWRALSLTLHVLEGGLVWPEGDRPGTQTKHVKFVMAPPVPVNVRIRVSGRQVTFWVEDPAGKVLPGREVAVNVVGAPAQAPRSADGKTTLKVEGKDAAQISVSDVQTGVTAVVEVPP